MKAMMTAMMTAAIKRRLFIFLPSACLSGLGLRVGLSGAPRRSGVWEEGNSAPRGQGASGGPDLLLLALPKGKDSSWGEPGSLGPGVGFPERSPPTWGLRVPAGFVQPRPRAPPHCH